MAPPALWLLLFFILPLFIVLGYSFSTSDPSGGVIRVFTFENFTRVFDKMYLLIFLRSFWYAFATTAITLAIAFPMAYYMAFTTETMKNIIMLAIILPFWTNFLIRMFAIMTLLGKSGLINSALTSLGLISDPLLMMNNTFGMYVGFIYFNLPFMILPIFSSLDRMDISQLEASLDLGASRQQTFMKITLPYAMPGIVAGIVFSFIPTLGNFVIPEFLGGADNFMIGNVITSQYLKARNWPFGSAISMVLMFVVMVFISLYIRYYDPSKNKNLVNF